jgi:16S rRNA (uracil1498-N3)-methyltransferase
MQIFYAPGITGDHWTLDSKESKHCIRVLRMKKGTQLKLIDGKGNLYEGEIDEPDQNSCKIRVLNIVHEFEKRDYRLHIAISPLKNPERFEWFIEKSVEIGIDEITPLVSRNSEKTDIRKERLNGIIISAMKQSIKSYLTVLNDPVKFEDFIQGDVSGKKMIAHCNEMPEVRKRIAETYQKKENATIMIGPEGDFTVEEVGSAVQKGFDPVHLGASRLRTETAGIAACHSIYFLNL